MREMKNMVLIMVMVVMCGIFSYNAGLAADNSVYGTESVETKIVTVINNAFTCIDNTLKTLNK